MVGFAWPTTIFGMDVVLGDASGDGAGKIANADQRWKI